MPYIDTALLTLTFAFGYIAFAYEYFADRKLRTMGSLYRNSAS
jgi:hypothetical protein